VADGYQQLIRRIEAVEADFQSIISVIRTRVTLVQQEQNLDLLASVDRTTKSQVVLQHTVEGLSVIVVAYYLSGLAGYVLKAMQEVGWISNANVVTGLFVPVALGLAFLLIYFGRKALSKLMAADKDH
jgi:uncharacterized membrane-anchored protein